MDELLRRRILEEWRGLGESKDRPDRGVHIKEILNELAPKLGIASRLREEEIIAAWAQVVGDFFALHSRPSKLYQGTLIVSVLQPTILYELDRQWRPLILSKLKKRFGGKVIKDVRFRLG